MGLFSKLGAVIGTAIGGPVGGAIGGTIGKAGDKALKGGSKSSGSESSGPVSSSDPMQTLAAIKQVATSPKVELKGDIKQAETFGAKAAPLEDPWQPTRTWYKALGGSADIDNVDFERFT